MKTYSCIFSVKRKKDLGEGYLFCSIIGSTPLPPPMNSKYKTAPPPFKSPPPFLPITMRELPWGDSLHKTLWSPLIVLICVHITQSCLYLHVYI